VDTVKIKVRGWLYDTVTGEWAKGKLKALPTPVPKGMYIFDYFDMVDRAVKKIYEGMTWEEVMGLKRGCNG
jgi:hypothetical protein